MTENIASIAPAPAAAAIMASAVIAHYDDQAVSFIRRQLDVATGTALISWTAILAAVCEIGIAPL